MTDLAKRKTLKTMAISGVGLAAGSFTTLTLAEQATILEGEFSTELAELTVNVSHSWTAQDLKVDIKNETDNPITITHITPGRIETHLGELDFDQFMESGDITLAPHGKASIGMDTRKAHKRIGIESGRFARSLQQVIRQNLSIVTDSESFAAVTLRFDPNIV